MNMDDSIIYIGNPKNGKAILNSALVLSLIGVYNRVDG
jgi:hypothetical protein